MTEFQTSIRIGRPIEEVFAFVSDPLNFPRWNSAVQAVRQTGDATYAMERDLPTGRAHNDLELFGRRQPGEFGIRTTSGPTPFTYRYALDGDDGQTVLRLEAEVQLDGVAGLLGPVAGRAVKRGVDDNFAELKRLLEA
jgi:carbon monoxide dehydrogenase subunit G